MLEAQKREVITYAQKMLTDGLVRGTGGNVSVFDRETGLLAITPSGMDYFCLTPEDIVLMDLDANVVEGRRKPSSEYELHRLLYKNRADLNAVVHAHSTYLTALATLREELPASNYMIALAGGSVPCSEYASYGTRELAENALESMGEKKAVLLANHGVVAAERDLKRAYNLAAELEQCAKVYLIARSAGKPFLLDDEEIETLKRRFETSYGQRE